MKKIEMDEIKYLQYRTIEKGFYEVHASSEYKIICEGNVCAGVLLHLMEQCKKDKGEITRVKTKEDWDFDTNTNKIRKENVQLKKQIKKDNEKFIKIKRLLK